MRHEAKVQLIAALPRHIAHGGILTHGATPKGYQWTCEDYVEALSLTRKILEQLALLGLDTLGFPYRFEGTGCVTLTIEPVDDCQLPAHA